MKRQCNVSLGVWRHGLQQNSPPPPLLPPPMKILKNKHPSTKEGVQRAKKVLSDSPGLVDFAVGLVNSVFNK